MPRLGQGARNGGVTGLGTGWHELCSTVTGRYQVTMMNDETTETDSDGSDGSSKGSARRRVDAYHEALRERAAMRELEQPFVIEARAWPPPRY